MLPQECPASLFEREAEVLFGALKTKSCLSEASSFCLAEKSTGVGKKMQTANFLCFVSFVRAKEMKRNMHYIHKKVLHLQCFNKNNHLNYTYLLK